MAFDPALEQRARKLVERYTAAGSTIATAESCTGGLVAGLITENPQPALNSFRLIANALQ